MKVNHKTFNGGYDFKNFEGAVGNMVNEFKATGNLTDASIALPNGQTAYDILKALEVTSFAGPEYAVVPTTGHIEASLVKDVVINTIEAEPYNISAKALIDHYGYEQFVEGLKAMRESFGGANFHIVLGESESELINQFLPLSNNLAWLEVHTVTPKYPINMTELLIPTILDKKYPVGYNSAHIGVIVVDVQQVYFVKEGITSNIPITKRVVALAGSGFKNNVHIEVALGTKISDIAKMYQKEDMEVRFIKNSIMTDPAVTEEDCIDVNTSILIALPEDTARKPLFFFRLGKKADSYTNSFISAFMPNGEKTAETNVHGEHRTCVNCGYCQKVCPVGLFPQLLHKHVDKEIITERLAELKIFDCIGCNLCNYICPSKIDIGGNIMKGKIMLEEQEISHKKYLLDGCDMVLEFIEEGETNE